MESKTETPFSLLEEFKTPTMEQWMALARSQLKGASFEEVLVSGTPEGIPRQPIYTAKDLDTLGITIPDPGEFPYIRGTAASKYFPQSCKTGIRLNGNSPLALNRLLKSLPEREETLLYLNPVFGKTDELPQNAVSGGVLLRNPESLAELLRDINVKSCTFCLDAGEKTFAYWGLLISYFREHGIVPDEVRGSVIHDPYSFVLLQEGRHDIDGYWRRASSLLEWSRKQAPRWSVLGVDGRVYHECGGHIVQELAYSLASAVESIRELTQRGFSADDVIQQIHFNFAIGSDFFMEIAKLRALRSLWAHIVEAYTADYKEDLGIHSFSSRWNKTWYAPHVNILRTTTEALSALFGGADAVFLDAFDFLTDESNPLSNRLAQNIPYILNEEGFCNTVLDPVGGSWMVESLTHQLGERAWSLFQEVEKEGGIAEAIQKGVVQSQIESGAQRKRSAIREERKVSVGSNQFEDLSEVPKEILKRETDPAEPTEKRWEQERALSKVSNEIAAGYRTEQPNPNLFDSVIAAFQTGVAVDDINLKLVDRVMDAKAKFIINNHPLRMQRATEEVEQQRKRGRL